MLQRYLSELLLIHIPEALVLSFVIAFFLKVKLDFKKIIMISIIVGFTVFILSSIPMLSFGYQSIIAILLYVILFSNIFNKNSLDSFLVTLIAFIILIIYELIIINLMTNYFKISTEDLLNDFVLNIITLWLKGILIFITGYIYFRFINKKKKRKS